MTIRDDITIRTAVPSDAPEISNMLQQLVAAGKRTLPADQAYVLSTYVENPARIRCSLAEDADGTVLGIQSLTRAMDGNRFNTPIGWGIIGTHVSPASGRRGVGSRLFEVTKQAARDAGLQKIEAFIGAANAEGQAYYEKMGFRTYRLADGAVCKAYDVEQ